MSRTTTPEVREAHAHRIESFEYNEFAPPELKVIVTCACSAPDDSGYGGAFFYGRTPVEAAEEWLDHLGEEMDRFEARAARARDEEN